jgi:hypothetical protein
MALDPRKRQKKLERKKAKERKALAVAKSRGAMDRFARAAAFPILDCFRGEDLWEQGIGWVVVSRRLSNGQIAFAAFLVDVFCLGVKNVIYNVSGPLDYEEKVVGHLNRTSQMKQISPAYACKLIEEAVAYAQRFGIEPHADYRRAHTIFGDVDASSCTEQFTFGKDGKPFFVSGPNDSPEKCRRIVALLQKHAGVNGSDYIIQLSPDELDGGIRRLFGDAATDTRFKLAEEDHNDPN